MNRGTIVVKVGKLPGKSKTSSWCNTEFHHQKFYVVLQFISTFKTKQNKKKRRKATCKKVVLLWVSRSMFWTSIHKLKTKKHDTSSSTKETCYEILTGEQLFFSSHHNHKKRKKKRKEGRKEEKGVLLCSSNFLALMTSLKQFVFWSPQKTNCFKIKKPNKKWAENIATQNKSCMTKIATTRELCGCQKVGKHHHTQRKWTQRARGRERNSLPNNVKLCKTEHNLYLSTKLQVTRPHLTPNSFLFVGGRWGERGRECTSRKPFNGPWL